MRMTIITQFTAMFATGIALLTGCQNKEQQNHQIAKNYPASIVSPTSRILQTSYPASIKGLQDVELFPQVSGTVTHVLKHEGERVKKGDIIFIIDQVPYQAALQTAKANLAAAEATSATALLTLQSKEQLFTQDIISSFDLQTSRNQYSSTQAQVELAKAQLLGAQNNLSYTEIKSPSDGVIGTLPYKLGALVSPSIPVALTTVSDNSAMRVYFSISENQLLDMIQKHANIDEAIAAMPAVSLKLSNNTIYTLEGLIESISGVINKQTGAVQICARFENPTGMLHAGGAGTIIIPSVAENAIVIPQTATFQLQNKHFVFRELNGLAKAHEIEVYPINNGTEYIVSRGINIGDTIINQGAGLLREGTPITVTIQ